MSENLEAVNEALRQVPIGSVVEAFLRARNRVKELKAKHIEELGPAIGFQNILEVIIMDHLAANKLQNLASSDGGMVYKSVRWSASIQDEDAFMAHVIAKKAWDLLDKRANVTVAREFLDEQKVPPPGVKLNSEVILCAKSGKKGK